eukprot:8434915-Pyramimonas_sp.AAC.1
MNAKRPKRALIRNQDSPKRPATHDLGTVLEDRGRCKNSYFCGMREWVSRARALGTFGGAFRNGGGPLPTLGAVDQNQGDSAPP